MHLNTLTIWIYTNMTDLQGSKLQTLCLELQATEKKNLYHNPMQYSLKQGVC